MQYDTVVFDWDGTLWNSGSAHQKALQAAARAAGYPAPSPEAISAYLGLPIEIIVARLFPGDYVAIIDRYLKAYAQDWRASSHLYPEVGQMLASLRTRGYKLALLSNKPRRAAKPEVTCAGLNSSFELEAFGDEVPKVKPEPDGLHHVLCKLATTSDRALFVGDTETDRACAERAGVTFAAALWGTKKPMAMSMFAQSIAWHRPEDALATL